MTRSCSESKLCCPAIPCNWSVSGHAKKFLSSLQICLAPQGAAWTPRWWRTWSGQRILPLAISLSSCLSPLPLLIRLQAEIDPCSIFAFVVGHLAPKPTRLPRRLFEPSSTKDPHRILMTDATKNLRPIHSPTPHRAPDLAAPLRFEEKDVFAHHGVVLHHAHRVGRAGTPKGAEVACHRHADQADGDHAGFGYGENCFKIFFGSSGRGFA